ncbi:MAG: HAD-IC family P-type ATPase [Anaerolineae bacterium]|nr:HAD-IC family P-type ATPase [Anaerolineae bacterium]
MQTQQRGDWHLRAGAQVVDALAVDPDRGLDSAEAGGRLRQHGPNELVARGLKSPVRILWEQVTEPLVMLLLVAAAISAFLGKADSVVAIMAIVVLNALLGLVQEYRAEQAMAALKRMSAPAVRVRREGQLHAVEAVQLVPGDIVLLEAGNVVPADARLLEAANLRVQEASLTGESYPVDKSAETLAGANLPLGDRRNMVYLGTSIAYGRGVAVVVSTGMRTELGRIAELIQTAGSERSPLQKRMGELGKVLLGAAVVIMVVAVIIGLLRNEPITDILVASVAIAVAVVPEGLPAVVTISLALGAQRMLQRRALIRKLPAVETLGSVTVICSDKTGTLTENRMTVKIIDVAGHTMDLTGLIRGETPVPAPQDGQALPENTVQTLLLAGALCNDAVLQHSLDGQSFQAVGDPTEGALVIAATHFGLWKRQLEDIFPRVGEVPFSSERKRMTTVHSVDESRWRDPARPCPTHFLGVGCPERLAFTKGAVDSLLDISTQVWVEGEILPLTAEWRARIEAANNQLAKEGLRVLGVAFRPVDDSPAGGDWALTEEGMIFIGMIGMIDPPRLEVRDAVATCKAAGIRPMMITGDHPLTAQVIARELGIAQDGGGS